MNEMYYDRVTSKNAQEIVDIINSRDKSMHYIYIPCLDGSINNDNYSHEFVFEGSGYENETIKVINISIEDNKFHVIMATKDEILIPIKDDKNWLIETLEEIDKGIEYQLKLLRENPRFDDTRALNNFRKKREKYLEELNEGFKK